MENSKISDLSIDITELWTPPLAFQQYIAIPFDSKTNWSILNSNNVLFPLELGLHDYLRRLFEVFESAFKSSDIKFLQNENLSENTPNNIKGHRKSFVKAVFFENNRDNNAPKLEVSRVLETIICYFESKKGIFLIIL